MPNATTFDGITEGSSSRYTATLVGPDGTTPVDGGLLTKAELTLFDLASDTIINSRNAQDVKAGTPSVPVHGVSFDSTGHLVWQMSAADNPMIGSDELERHVAIFRLEWTDANNVAQRLDHQVEFLITRIGDQARTP